MMLPCSSMLNTRIGSPLSMHNEIAEDDRRHGSEKIEALSKDAVERLEKTLKAKEDEIMAV